MSRNKIFSLLIILNLSNFYNYLVLIFAKVQFKDNRFIIFNRELKKATVRINLVAIT